MDLNGITACYQHCSNGITMWVQNQWSFLKVEILNGFSRRVNNRNQYLKNTTTILEEFAAHFVVLDFLFCRIAY